MCIYNLTKHPVAPNIGLLVLKACEATYYSVLILNSISFLKRGEKSIGNENYVRHTKEEYMIFKMKYFSLHFQINFIINLSTSTTKTRK